MSFWKPETNNIGDVAKQISSAKTKKNVVLEKQDETSQPFVYNPRTYLPLQKQRELLPIAKCKREFLYLIENYRVVVILGSTGSGKTTQIPQFLLEAGWCNENRMIAVSEPRRIAAISACQRVHEELSMDKNDIVVGYAVRFDEHRSGSTKILYVTDGVLMQLMTNDPLLLSFSVIMIDEAHERSIATDILMGCLKKLQKTRPELRIIVASATFHAMQIVDYFGGKGNVGFLPIDGHPYPIDIYYSKKPVSDYIASALEVIIYIHTNPGARPGDILVFLPSVQDVQDLFVQVQNAILNSNLTNLTALPLYSSLPSSDIFAALKPSSPKFRKVVIATNVAETSLTIDGIQYVIDTGFCKTRTWSASDKADLLSIVPIAKDSAVQRAGRAGRMKPGICIRLYTKNDFETKMAEASVPEILRSNLIWMILLMKSIGIENITKFEFPTKPQPEAIAHALEELYTLDALTLDGHLTEIGRKLHQLPVDPKLARAIIEAEKLGCTEQMVTIAAMICTGEVFDLSHQHERRAFEEKRMSFSVAEGDLLTLLNIYNACEENKFSSSWCRRHGLKKKALEQAKKIRKKLLKSVTNRSSTSCSIISICRSITAGYYSNACVVQPDGSYLTLVGGRRLYIHSSSVCSNRFPKYIVAVDITITTSNYAQLVTVIEPDWLPQMAPKVFESRESHRGAMYIH